MPDSDAQTPTGGTGPMARPKPVFVDRTGRRRRLTVLAGTGMAAGLAASLGLVAMGLFGGSPTAVPGWPDGRPNQQHAVVDMLGTSPSATGDPGALTTGPAGTVIRSSRSTPQPTSTPAPGLTATSPVIPGQGTGPRTTPPGKASKSPRKPA